MKNKFILFILLSLTGRSFSQTPEKIYGKNKVLHTNDYYLEQMDLWKKEVDKDPSNANSWFNYYRSSRNAYVVGEETDSLNTKGINRFYRLKTIVDEMEKKVPDSYEYNFAKWLNGNNDASLFPYLKKAHELAPNESEPLMSLIYYYEINGNYSKRDESIRACYKIGDFSPGIHTYTTNMLMGLEKDAIIFTEGDKDTDAILLLQQGKGIRTDVQMLNLNLLLIKDYRDRIFKELGIPTYTGDPLNSFDEFKDYQRSIMGHVSKNNSNRPVYVAISVGATYTIPLQGDLYLTGLAYLYSEKTIEYVSSLKKNLEEIYVLDKTKIYFSNDISESWVKDFNTNYIPSLALLSKYYTDKGDNNKARFYKDKALLLAQDADRMDKYVQYFN